MKTKILIILIVLIGLGAGGVFVWKNISVLEVEVPEAEKEEAPVTEEKIEAPAEEELPKEERAPEETVPEEKGFEWFQTGNTQQITQLQTKSSNELEDNKIGATWSGLWMSSEWENIFKGEVLDVGLKRTRLAANNFDWDRVDWSKPEFSIDPSHDDFITSLADSGVTITYVLSFWDKALGEEKLSSPRFKTEEEIQRYLDFVQFIVGHFKDRVQYFEIWNEPNIKETIQWIEVEDYINLVKRAVLIIRQEYPEVKIVVGGTTYLIEPESREYLFAILRSDIMPLVDAVSWHPMYGTSPGYDYYREYYYNYPSLVREIKDVASSHGFKGEYIADEITWRTSDPETAISGLFWPYVYSEVVAAKYHARGIVMHLGIDVIVGHGGLFPEEMPTSLSTVQNLCTIMAGAKPIDLPIEIQSEATNIKSYTFSLSNGDKLVALWTDGIAVDDDPGVNATLTIPNISAQKVIGIDILKGYQQSIVTSSENGNLVIQNLIVKDYPLILQVAK